jgi:hypothetical protein
MHVASLAHRNLSKGQQAMALAMIYPEPRTCRRASEQVSMMGIAAHENGRPI